jgi:hypothetical protein
MTVASTFCTGCGQRPRAPGTAAAPAAEAPPVPAEAPVPGRPGRDSPPANGSLRAKQKIAAATVLVLLVAAAGGGWLLYHGHARHAVAANPSRPTPAHRRGIGSSQQPPTQSAASSSLAPTSPAPTSSVPTSSVPTSPAPSSSAATPDTSSPPGGTGSGTSVALAPRTRAFASAHPVGVFVSRYFTAINTRNYRIYATLFEPGTQPIAGRSAFKSAYRTTADSRVRLASLAPTADGGWAAGVSFVSHQDSAQSHTGTACTAWRITLYLQPRGAGYELVPPPADYRSSSRACS